MKKILVSIIIFGTIGLYSLLYGKNNQNIQTVVAPTTTTQQTTTSQTVTSTNTTGYKNGTYTGTSFDAYYGNVQVRATIADGKITNIEILDHPSGHHESEQINANALPILQQEAIAVQSSNVNAVSGATFTSDAFNQSLASALSQAN